MAAYQLDDAKGRLAISSIGKDSGRYRRAPSHHHFLPWYYSDSRHDIREESPSPSSNNRDSTSDKYAVPDPALPSALQSLDWIPYPLPWQVGHTRRGRQERSERRVPFVVHALRAPDVVKRHSIAVGMAQKFRLRREVGPDRVPSVGVIPYQVSFEETVEVRLDVVVMRDVSPASRANFHVRRNEAIDGIAHEGHPQGANGLVQIPLIVFGVGRLVLQFCHGSDVSSQGGGTALGDVAERDRMRVNMNGVVPSRMMVR
eukprot:CAMPEP_0181136322 /NCGR_PEP_ID=MMETSP1071-20121207/33118_1 /TAXON_ID=35127 /ORGANISM="Thalassiosira sp., Strain NH16" /LENGTH=257 /DNA_ID=CAMNT_0023223017 /DNA_START=269 /DNA_END=1047 /DNA_ORIENTATION=+